MFRRGALKNPKSCLIIQTIFLAVMTNDNPHHDFKGGFSFTLWKNRRSGWMDPRVALLRSRIPLHRCILVQGALHCCLAVYISLRWSAAYLLFCIAIIWWHCWKDFSISEQVSLLCSKVVLWNCAHIFITMLCWRISVHHIKVCNSALFKVKSEKCSVSYICSEHTSPLLLCCDQGFNHQRHFCHNTFLS